LFWRIEAAKKGREAAEMTVWAKWERSGQVLIAVQRRAFGLKTSKSGFSRIPSGKTAVT
jgi:hypothetical protein